MSEPSRRAQRAFYDDIWRDIGATELNHHERTRMATIAAELRRLQPGSLILEVGCGRGWLSGLVLQRYGLVTAFDLSVDPIAKARKAFPDVTFETRDVVEDPPEGEFDLVVSSEVIEHIVDKQPFVNSLINVTRPGGHIILTTPNQRLRSRWEHRPTFVPQPVEEWVTRGELRALFKGCEVLASRTFFFDIGGDGVYRLLTNRFVKRLRREVAQVDRVIGRSDLGLYQLLVARKRP